MSFAETMDDGVFLDDIDNDFDLDDDHVTQLATELWLEILGENGDDSDAIINIQQYVELIASKDEGFLYAFALYSDGKANGLIWQTATMRRNFELFGGYFALDTMKRSINKWLLPYMSVSMYTEHRKMCLGAKAIICGERKEAYMFMRNFVFNNTPMRPASSVNIVTGDVCF